MLTYDLSQAQGPLYLHLYQCLKEDILSGKLASGDKLPSKRSFARQEGISTITVQNAYDQLASEGYIYTLPKRGYYVAELVQQQMSRWPSSSSLENSSLGSSSLASSSLTSSSLTSSSRSKSLTDAPNPRAELYQLSSNATDPRHFPFSVWARLSRSVISEEKEALMTISSAKGVRPLREAIAMHLASFRGMQVDPAQIVVGAGTEYLYGLLSQLLGEQSVYALENPGYKKLVQIYQKRGISCKFIDIDDQGMPVAPLNVLGIQIAHISPNHHFPTGITMPASRRYELLAWANQAEDRYIIEDDYDSEFRSKGKPIPTLFSMDACQKVIYINTFSKSLTPTIRISYMVLPPHLAKRFSEEFAYLSSTVSNFEQYTLARFIAQGYFEKHINRMRLFYQRQRQKLIEAIQQSPLSYFCHIQENNAGLHFLIEIQSQKSPAQIQEWLLQRGILLHSLSDYRLGGEPDERPLFLVNYSALSEKSIEEVLHILRQALKSKPEDASLDGMTKENHLQLLH